MKKFVTLILCLVTALLSALCFVGCADKGENDYDFYVPDGAPALSIARFIHDGEQFGQDKKINYHVVSASTITAVVTEKKPGFIIMPLNTATMIYDQKDAPYVMAAVITHGNFYFAATTKISSASDLVGKVVYVPMRGKVPDWTFLSVLKANNIEYVEKDSPESGKVAIKYFNEGSDVVGALPVQNDGSIVGLLPEPAITNLSKKKTVYSERLDLQELFDPATKTFPQAVLMVKKSVADKNADLINSMAGAFADNVQWVKSNIADAVSSIKENFNATTLVAATLSEKEIDGCKIYWQSSAVAKKSVKDYIERIKGINDASAKSVGDSFFI